MSIHTFQLLFYIGLIILPIITFTIIVIFGDDE